MPINTRYRGFSFFEYERLKQFSITDIELVKLDLLNHIFTRRGERVMMPNFGTSIPDMTFEPLIEETIQTIISELTTVFDYDPRVELADLDIRPNFDTGVIIVGALLFYVELNVQDSLEITLEFQNL